MDINLINNAILNENEETYKNLNSVLNIEQDQIKYFLKYWKIYNTLFESDKYSKYANCFNGKELTEIPKIPEIKEQTLIKVISNFINLKGKEKELIKLNLNSTENLKFVKKILNEINNSKRFVYEIKLNKNLSLENDLDLFKYISNFTEKEKFNNLFKNVIENQIEIDNIFYINIDKFDLDKLISYSEKFPNKIKCLYAFKNENDEKIKKLCELNSESLIMIPNCKLNLYQNLNNIEIITVNSKPIPNPIPENFNFSKIKEIRTINLTFENKEQDEKLIINYINKCPNLEKISFSSFCEMEFETFLKIFTSISNTKIKFIQCQINDLEPESDFTPLFNKLPELEILDIEEHESMCYAYSIKPVWTSEKKRIAFPLLEILINNYLKNKTNFIRLDFDDEFEGFYDYFKNKNNVLNKVLSFRGEKFLNYELPFIKECSIKKSEDTLKFNVKKIEKIEIKCELNNNDLIQKFIEKVKPLFISFVIEENIEIVNNHLKNIDDDLKVVSFEKLNKIFIKNQSNILFEEI